ncbi:T9SS type B sorting domain-containing protein [Flavobacterium sp. ASW18X]|uniref:T9SS type B sorting domain-containing protein n=1 Tax=Flavobacterium sp. ASW18X TaxID=2572595 RepID=UPI0010AE9E0A|nr:T9SS type B sorting domain-containing protein [Flavobacterium sp. ASW18X]TKD65124.1 T9SS type B sorting domain-containing protein [Flavobacterium sp. ASW18X]
MSNSYPKTYLLILFFLAFSMQGIFGQVKNNFDPRYNNSLRGDLTLIGNNIVNRDGGTSTTEPEDPYNDIGNPRWFWTGSQWVILSSEYNDQLNMQYIDVDNDTSTFSSSSATLSVPDVGCSLIRYAGLYWSAVYVNNDRSGINQVKLKTPGSSTYIDITATEVLFDGDGDVDFGYYSPYASYADITSIVAGLADPNGEYTVANILASNGSDISGGVSGGWTMVVVYENPNYPGKYITTFDGYAGIKTGETVDIPFNGFTTLPNPFPVNARLGISTLEGDNRIEGDGLSFSANMNAGFTPLGNTANPTNNFFNSNITDEGLLVNSRNPNSINTLGWDIDLFTIPNPLNGVIPNDETGAVLRASSSQDKYDIFFGSFDVEIIEPNIVLTKTVEDIGGNDITGQGVNLGQYLDYVLTFENTGNDDAINYQIRDVLPINVTFLPDELDLPAGVTYTYNSATREVVFSIPDNLVAENDPPASIRMGVRVAESCFDFIDACTDLIQNLAYSTYRGFYNDNVITDDPSVTDFDNCGYVTPGATNFLLDDLENCDFSRTVLLCGEDVLLDAGDNFDNYVWYRDNNQDGLVDAGDTVITDDDEDNDPSTIVVDDIGIYIVDKQVADPCKGFEEIITVERFGQTQTNPIIDLINDTSNTVDGTILVCPNDGRELPEIFLCGLNDTELIQINIPDALSIEWEQLVEGSCSAAATNCANTNNSCSWTQVGSGFNYTASDAGEYKLSINYEDGCSSIFYFNVYKNPLNPQVETRDLMCGVDGQIRVVNMPADYEFQLVNDATDAIVVPYSDNNGPEFTIDQNGAYRVEMRQVGVTGGCEFVVDNIGIRERNVQLTTTITNTSCNGLGAIGVSLLDADVQYYYSLIQNGTEVDSFGPSNDNNYTFENKAAGDYTVRVTTDAGCDLTQDVTILDESDLELEAVISQHISCREGNIQMNSTGGQTPHTYAIYEFVDESGTTVTSYNDPTEIPNSEFQTSVIFDILIPGTYTFAVIDRNNCFAISNPVTIVLVPSVEYTTSSQDESCFGANDGSINLNLTSSNGYTVTFNLLDADDNQIATNGSGQFNNLAQGDYTVVVNQRKGNTNCDFLEPFTIGGPTSAVIGDIALIQDYTCLQNGIIEAQNVTGGAAPYAFSIDGVNFVNGVGAERFSNLTDGTYRITIRDANDCTFVTDPITLLPLNPPTNLDFTASAVTCPDNTSNVTATVTAGTAPFVFEIIAPSLVTPASASGSTATFNNLSPDTYNFRVTDSKGCVYTETFTIAPITPINVVGQLVSNISCLNATDGEARFTVNGFSTNYNYTITGPQSFSGTNETNTTIDLTSLAAGTYDIAITDNATNCTDTASVTVEAPTAQLAISIVETQPTCTTDGSVAITATGGWGSYTYTLTNPDTTVFGTNTTGSFNGLTQTGQYTVQVEDANGCEVPGNFTLNAAIAPVLELVPNDFCYDNATGLTLTANVTSGGDGNFEYSINGGDFSSTNSFINLSAGTYTVTVQDGNSCTDTETITINPQLSVTAMASNIIACATSTTVDITAAGGDGNYVYAVVLTGTTPAATDFSTTNPATVNAAGTYDVYVRDNSGNTDFCEAVDTIVINQDPALNLSISNTAILCSGDASSTLTVTITGGEGPYTYSIDNGTTYQPENTFENLAAGSYHVRVRDANSCEIDQIYAISEPLPLSASAAVAQLAECNPSGAEIRITNVIGGTAPYTYSFDGGTTYGASSIENLLPGDHTLFVRDANNCTYPMTVTVQPEPTPPNATATVDYECDGEGIITVTPDSADFDYTYLIDGTPNTPDTSNIFNNVPTGNHTITVNYTSNIAPTPSILLTENFGTGANTPISEIDPAYCYEPQDGSTSLCGFGTDTHIQDGEYSVTNLIVNPYGTWRSPSDHSGLANGRFLAINVGGVAGVGGIVYQKTGVEVIPNQDIEISLWAFNLLRTGSTGGDPSIEIQLVDGSGTIIASTTTGNIPKNNNANDWQNYTVNLNPGANANLDIVIRTNSAVTQGNDIAIDDIQALQYPEACPSSITLDVLVEEGNELAASITNFTNISCNTGSDGAITFQVENFDTTNGYEYQVNGGGYITSTNASVTLPNLTANTYVIDVRDINDNSCAIQLTQVLTEPTVVEVTATLDAQVTCTTGATITANATGGTPNYTYQLEDNLGTPITNFDFATNGTNTVFADLAAGTYIVRARDTNGCEDIIDSPIIVNAPAVLTFTTTATACYSGANDGQVVVNVTAGNGDYLFSLNGGPFIAPVPSTLTTYTFDNLGPGTYTVDVIDASGCTAPQQSVTITEQLVANAVLDQDLTCLVDAQVTINARGGSGTYSYEWSNDGGTTYNTTGFTGNVFTTNVAGTYQFQVTDTTSPTACSVVTNTVTITPAVQPVISSVTPTHILCHGESTGALDVVIDTSVGVPPYVINVVETGSGTIYNTQTTGLPAGDYQVTITDDKGCVSNPFLVTINQPDVINYTTTDVPITCNASGGTDSGSITVSGTTGGTAEYTYILSANNGIAPQTYTTSPGNIDYTFTILDFGIYTVDVVDANGCAAFSTEVIASPPNDLDIDVTTTTANCTSGGTAIITVSAAVGSGDYTFGVLETYSPPYSTSYQAPDTPGGNTATITGLIPGVTYTFVVYDNTTMCYYFEEADAPIDTPSSMTVTSQTESNVTCTGNADGSVSFEFTGFDAGATDVRYEIFNRQSNLTTGQFAQVPVNAPTTVTVSDFGALAPGEYYVLLTEIGGPNNGCTVSGDLFSIRESANPLDLDVASPTNDNCNLNAGVITATGRFGTAPYEYQYLPDTAAAPLATDAGWTTNTSANVEAGDYIVYVKDAYDCIQQAPITVLEDVRPEITLAIVDECVAEGSFEVLVTLDNPAAASAPFQISINGGAYQNFTFNASNEYTVTGLSSGLTQSINVRDVNGCEDSDTIDIYPPLQFNARLTTALDCEPAPANNAEITIDVLAGSGSYDYAIDGPGTVDQAQTNMVGTSVVWTDASVAGDYAITVYDTSTAIPYCLGTITVNVPAAVQPIFTHTPTDVTCNGGADGTIQLFETNTGINPLTYTISPAVGSFNSTTLTFENLPAGTYTVTGTGTNDCELVINNIIIDEPTPVSIDTVTTTDFLCTNGNNENNATISVDGITGGSGTYVRYEFIEEDDPNTVPVETPVIVQNGNNPVLTITDFDGGVYTINVYDSAGCMDSTTATIVPFDELQTATAAITNPLSCSPGSDGEITLTVTSTANDVNQYEYSIDNGATWQNTGNSATPNVFGGLTAGTYNFLVRHLVTGCIISTSETLTDPNTFTIDVDVVRDVLCFGTATGEVTFQLIDATYTNGFSWEIFNTNGTPTNPADDTSEGTGSIANTGPTAGINLPAGSYYVVITQDNFPTCENTQAFTIAGPNAAITANHTTTPITCMSALLDDGSITITNVQGGWGGYTYFVGADGVIPTATDFVNNASFGNLTAGTYDAWVRDSEGCEILVQDDILLTNPTPIQATLLVTNDNCTNFEGELEVVGIPITDPVSGGQGSNYTYQLFRNGTAFGSPQTSTTFINLGEGNYEVVVLDQWGCTTTTNAELLYDEMNISTTVDKQIDCSITPAGTITVNVNGGSGNFNFEMTVPNTGAVINQTTGTFTNLTEVGVYTFVVTDTDTNNPVCTRTITQQLVAPSTTTLDTPIVSDVSCFGLADGSITVVLAATSPGINEDAPYNYNLYDNAGVLISGPQSNPTFTGLAAGFYQIEAVSAKECASVRTTVEVEQPTVLDATETVTAFACAPDNSVNTATLTITATGGTSAYLYSIDGTNYQTQNTFEIIDNGTVQTITYYVRDANGCPFTDSVTINPINTFNATVAQVVQISCAVNEEVTITVSDNGDVSNVYTFELLPIGNTAATLTGTPAYNQATFELTEVGSYTFRVTDTATGCYFDTAAYEIAPYDTIDVIATATAQSICYGDTSGEITIDVSGYNGTYDYTVYNQDGTATTINGSGNTTTNPLVITGLAGGNYFVRVTETANPLCVEDSNIVTIISPDRLLMADAQEVANVGCTNDSGEINVNIEGGYLPYDVVLTNTTTGNVFTQNDVAAALFTGLGAGAYTIQVTDNQGCVVSDTETLIAPTPITAGITATPTMLQCYGDTNASVTATNATGGEGVYLYELNSFEADGVTLRFTSGAQNLPTFNNLGAGIYSIRVSDGWNCEFTTPQVVITEPVEVFASLRQLTAMTCTTDATIELTATGGTAPYSYSTDGITYSSMSGGDTHTFNVTEGNYQYFVIDVNGCEGMISNQVTVEAVPDLMIDLDLSAAMINCTGEATARITADASGGLGSYSYELFTDAALTNRIVGPQTEESFNDLAAGSYWVRVTSVDCITVSTEAIITEPTPLQIDREEFTNITCAGEEDGSIYVEVSGGTGEIYYAISPNLNQFDTDNTFTNLAPGNYVVIAQDENGCFETFDFELTAPAPLEAEAINIEHEICFESADGTFELDITGGTAPYFTSLNANNPTDFVEGQISFTDLAATTHVVFVRDSQGCETTVFVEINPGVDLAATVTPMYACTGNIPDNSLDIVFNDETVLPNVLYALDSTDPDDMQLNADFTNITPGMHYLTIAHDNGCINTIDFEIENFEPLTLTLESINVNEITAIANGGVEDYTFYFGDHDNGTDNTYYINRTDTYTVTVVDQNGCEMSAEIFMEFIDIEIPNFFTPDGSGTNDTWVPNNIEGFPNILTIIFDRYGRELYRMKLNDAPWDGTYQGQELPTGDYWYVIKLRGENDDREMVGHFTLYR